MPRRTLFCVLLTVSTMLLASCWPKATPTAETALANPASVYCVEQGGTLELRTDATGGVAGVCLFADGSECDEWALFRHECQPGDSLQAPAAASTATPAAPLPTPEATATALPYPAAVNEAEDNNWAVYRNATLGYRFSYPADAHIETDDPSANVSVVGPETDGERWPMITISHPTDRPDYRPSDDIDLLTWLTDHNLLGDERQPDVTIAGTTAIHLRHERSPQSYAYDRYYMRHAGQLYMILIDHTGDKEDWALYDRFLQSLSFAP